ncbi:MAG: CPBP family glutamic-type intramembrane protease [Patescibacteria group bacterium]
MLLAVSFFEVVGLASINLSSGFPLLGISGNYLLHLKHLTLNQALTSPFVVIGVLIVIVVAPLLEEVVFRGICPAVSDDNGKLKPKLLFIVLGWSFIGFGLAHGHGLFSLMVQGVGGLLLARLWFCNGPNMRESYFSCVAAHSLYNISVVIIAWLWAS